MTGNPKLKENICEKCPGCSKVKYPYPNPQEAIRVSDNTTRQENNIS